MRHRDDIPEEAEALTAAAEDHLVKSDQLTVAGDLAGARDLLEAIRTAPAWPRLPASLRSRVLTDLGWISGARMELARARGELHEAVELADQAGERGILQNALLEAAVVERYAGRYAGADAAYRRAEEVACDPAAQARALFGRATVAQLTFDFIGARRFLRLAAEAARDVPEGQAADLLWADICREQGVERRLAGEFDEAERVLRRAGELYERHGRLTGAANIQRELAALRTVLGDFGQARSYLDAAYAFYQRAQRPLGMAAVRRRKGDLEVEADRLDDATQLMLDAERLFTGEPYGLARVALSLARIARLASCFQQARTRLERAQRIATAHKDLAALSEIALERGRLFRETGNRDKALNSFELALAALGHAAPPQAEALARHNVAFELIAAGRAAEALPHALRDVEICEQLGYPLSDPYHRKTFYEQHRASYLQAIHVAAVCGDGAAALRVATAARSDALAAFIGEGSGRLGPQLRRKIADVRLLQESRLQAASAPAGSSPLSAEDRDAALNAAYADLERETSAALRAALESSPDSRELQRSLPAGGHALLLDLAEDDKRICWNVWLPASGKPHIRELLLPDELRALLTSFADKSADAAWHAHRRELGELGRLLVPEGLAAILHAAERPPPVIISSGSLLATFPMAALRIGQAPLARLAQLSWVPSLKVWQALAHRRVRGGGTGSTAYLHPGLRGTRHEELALRRFIPPLRILRSTEIRSTIEEASNLEVLVLSAHGNSESGLAQALLLTDSDQITAAELLQARLPDLVVMGACWSGNVRVEAAQEPLGLPTAALLGGAKCVIAGLAEIGSSSTGKILSRFYREVASGAAYASALRTAQLCYLRRHPRALPAQWAGLIAVGDGTASRAPAGALAG